MFELTEKRMVDLIHQCMEELIRPGDRVCDCTMGNGYDTLKLCKLAGEKGIVYSFDIQQKAIDNTRALLESHQAAAPARLILDSHSHLEKYIEGDIRFFVFNLGYLPNGDPGIITRSDSTVKAIGDILDRTMAGGGGAVLSYYGHPGGLEEKTAVEKLLQNLSPKYFSVMKIESFNRSNMPPVLYLVKRVKNNK